MNKYEIIDFLEWAKENRHLEFPESRKVNMAEAYLESQSPALPQADDSSNEAHPKKNKKLGEVADCDHQFVLCYDDNGDAYQHCRVCGNST